MPIKFPSVLCCTGSVMLHPRYRRGAETAVSALDHALRLPCWHSPRELGVCHKRPASSSSCDLAKDCDVCTDQHAKACQRLFHRHGLRAWQCAFAESWRCLSRSPAPLPPACTITHYTARDGEISALWSAPRPGRSGGSSAWLPCASRTLMQTSGGAPSGGCWDVCWTCGLGRRCITSGAGSAPLLCASKT